MRFLAVAAADSSALVAELDAVAAQDAAAVQAALAHAALQLRLSSTTTMSASTQPSMARLLRARRQRRTPLPQAVLAHADRAVRARSRRCLVEAELHDDDERKHTTLHGQAPPFSSSAQAAVASSIDARAGRNARTSPAGAVRGDLDCDDIQERAVHGGQEVTMQLGEKKMATFIR